MSNSALGKPSNQPSSLDAIKDMVKELERKRLGTWSRGSLVHPREWKERSDFTQCCYGKASEVRRVETVTIFDDIANCYCEQAVMRVVGHKKPSYAWRGGQSRGRILLDLSEVVNDERLSWPTLK